MTSHRLARYDLDQALEEAESHGLTVHDDGSVSYPAAGETEARRSEGGTLMAPSGYVDEFIARAMSLIDSNPNRAKAQAIAGRIAHARDRARADEDELAAVTMRLSALPGLDSPDADAGAGARGGEGGGGGSGDSR